MPTNSYWLADPARPVASAPLPRGRVGARPDVIVVGGGVTGCACALALAERGVSVRLHEAREIAGGASGRNGGFALRGAAAPYDRARTDLGAERARLLMESTERGLDRLESLAGDAFRRVGSLRLAADDGERAALQREHDALRADGFAVEWVDELEPPLDRLYRGAILHPRDGAIHPARWVRRLARQAVEAGAELCEGSAVELDALEADAVVVAVDGYTAALLPELRELVRPTRGQVLATEPLGELLYTRPHYAREGYDYWHQLPDGRLVIGGQRDVALTDESTDADATTAPVQDALESLVRRLTGTHPAVTHRWSGIWGTTPDLVPLVGAVTGRERTWVAGGYSGHGNVLGLVCGELAARALLGEAPIGLELFDPARFA